MRKHKIIKDLFLSVNALVVEPNNALTPREILQQFGQGFTSAYKEPTDDIYDDKHTDDDLVDNVLTFEDEFEALDMMSQPMYPLTEKNGKDESIEEEPKDETNKPEQGCQCSPEQGDNQSSGDS